QFLPCSSFSQNQHSGICWRYALHLGENRLKRRAAANNMIKSVVPFVRPSSLRRVHNYLLPTCATQLDQPSVLHGHANGLKQDGAIKRLDHKFHRTVSHRVQTHVFIAVSSNKNGRDRAAISIQLSLQVESRHPRHADVADQTSSFVLPART